MSVLVRKVGHGISVDTHHKYMTEVNISDFDLSFNLFSADERNMAHFIGGWTFKFELPVLDEVGIPCWGIQLRRETSEDIIFLREDLLMGLTRCIDFALETDKKAGRISRF